MCSILKFRNCMGRNFDYEISLKEKSFKYDNPNGYDMIGMVTGLVKEYPLFYDAMNEYGLCIGGLAFDGNAHYEDFEEIDYGDYIYTPYNFILKILSSFKTVGEVKEHLKKAHIFNKPFSKEFPNSDLHWFVCDKEQSIVIESTKSGLNVYDNPFDVMTNNPPFDEILKYKSRGTVTKGLTGDYTSQARFDRLCYLKDCCIDKELPCNDVQQTFHLLSGVEQSYGATPVGNKYEYTMYSVVYNMENLSMYVRSYDGTRNNGVLK